MNPKSPETLADECAQDVWNSYTNSADKSSDIKIILSTIRTALEQEREWLKPCLTHAKGCHHWNHVILPAQYPQDGCTCRFSGVDLGKEQERGECDSIPDSGYHDSCIESKDARIKYCCYCGKKFNPKDSK